MGLTPQCHRVLFLNIVSVSFPLSEKRHLIISLRNHFRSFPKQVVGMDISAAMIEYCTTQHVVESAPSSCNRTEIQFAVADAGNPSSMMESWRSHFDLLTSFSAMHWVHDQEAALNSMHLCLKKRGIALMTMVLQPNMPFVNGEANFTFQ